MSKFFCTTKFKLVLIPIRLLQVKMSIVIPRPITKKVIEKIIREMTR